MTERHWTKDIFDTPTTTSLGREYIEKARDYRDQHIQQCENNQTLAYIDGDTQYETKVLFIIGGTRVQRIENLVARCIFDRKFDGYEPEDFGCYPRKVDHSTLTIEERRVLSMKVASHSMYGRGKPYGYDWDLDSDSVDWEDEKSYGDFLKRVFTKDITSLNTKDLTEIYFYVSEQSKDDWYKHFDHIVGGNSGIKVEFLHLDPVYVSDV